VDVLCNLDHIVVPYTEGIQGVHTYVLWRVVLVLTVLPGGVRPTMYVLSVFIHSMFCRLCSASLLSETPCESGVGTSPP